MSSDRETPPPGRAFRCRPHPSHQRASLHTASIARMRTCAYPPTKSIHAPGTHTRTRPCTRAHMHTYTHARMHACRHAHMHACTGIHTCINALARVIFSSGVNSRLTETARWVVFGHGSYLPCLKVHSIWTCTIANVDMIRDRTLASCCLGHTHRGIVWCHAASSVPYHAVLCRAASCHVVLHCVVSCHAVPWRAVCAWFAGVSTLT